MKYSYTPYGVCSRKIDIDIEDGIMKDGRFTGGCNGNTTGVATLVKGMNAEEAVKKLKGIDCNGRGTSCPDQLALALEEALERE